jgi:hypothetical protein
VTPWWKLGLALAGGIGLLSLLDRVPGWAAVTLLAIGFVVLGLAGALWGADSRARGDWSPDARSQALR